MRRSENISYTDWDAITGAAREWCMKQSDAEETKKPDGMPKWTFDWEGPEVTVDRGEQSSMILQNFGLVGDDLAYYQMIGGHDWRVMMRMANAQLGRTEIGFSVDPLPGFVVADRLYDDAFSVDELAGRVRNVALTAKYLLMLHKHMKIQAGMKYAEPNPEWSTTPEGRDDRATDLEQDRLRMSVRGMIGGVETGSIEALMDALVLQTMQLLEQKDEVVDEQHLRQVIAAEGNTPEHLIEPAIQRLKRDGTIYEVQPGKLRIARRP